MGRLAATEKIFLADRTITHVFSGLAVVVVKERPVNAHPAITTMAKVFSSPNTTKSTIMAMIWVITGGHPEVTNGAMVLGEDDSALDAGIRLA